MQEREKRARKFVEYALTKPGVYFVTMQTLIAWMVDPVPVEEMDTWLAQRCNGPLTTKTSKVQSNRSGSDSKRGAIVERPDIYELGGISSSTFTQAGGISNGSIALAAASVLTVTAVLTRRRRLRKIARAQK
jgi:hypothetical protein